MAILATMPEIDVADYLRGVPLFNGLPDHHIETLAQHARHRTVTAGEWVFHQGDPGDSMFVVATGSVELFKEPSETVMTTAGRGESIGELSLLTSQPRSAAARARRDSELVSISRADFDRLLEAEPRFAVALVGVLGERLRRARTVEPPARLPRTIALVPLHDGLPVSEIAASFTTELAAFGPVVRLDRAESAAAAIERIDPANRRVLLVAASAAPEDPWSVQCVREADRVIGLTAGGPVPPPSVADGRLRGCDLAVYVQPGVEPDLQALLGVLDPSAIYVLRAGGVDGVRRAARRLVGRSVGVVLSGGGARGLAHIGVVEQLQQAGVAIDRIGAASMGATVGSLFAEQRSADEVAEVVEAAYVRDNPLRGRTIPIVALSRGVKGFAMQHKIHGERRIEGLDISFYCVSSDLAAQVPVVHRSGLVAVAVSASQALPAFVPPVQDGDRMLVDGAIFSNLPVEPMRATGEGPVIAVDVSGRLPTPRAPRSRLPFLRRWIAGPAAQWAPPITETVLRSILLGNVASDAAARDQADVVIAPQLRGVSTMRFRDLDGVRALGREAVRTAIEAGALDALPRS